MGKIKIEKKLAIKILLALFVFFAFSPVPTGAQDIYISVTAQVRSTSTPPYIPPEPPKGSYVPVDTEIIFKGRAFPSAMITILKNGAVVANFRAEESGLFERTIRGVPGGVYNFSISAEDTEGRKTESLNFNVTVLESMITTISNIFIPSTISLNPQIVIQGESVNISGQAFPGSTIRIFVNPSNATKETAASSQGKWFLGLETGSLTEGEYKVRSKTFFGDGEQSGFSRELTFKILKKAEVCNGADLNNDKRVDLIDFSILLYFWEQSSPENRCADINSDGMVDIIDFSIMMYQWTG